MKSNSLAEQMTRRLNSFYTGSFGIARRDEDSPLILCTRGLILPVMRLSVLLWGQNQTTNIHMVDLPQGVSLLLDDQGGETDKARLVIVQQPGENILAATGSAAPICGSVTIIASSARNTSVSAFAVRAVFAEEDGVQQSYVLWDSAPELVQLWDMEAKVQEVAYRAWG